VLGLIGAGLVHLAGARFPFDALAGGAIVAAVFVLMMRGAFKHAGSTVETYSNDIGAGVIEVSCATAIEAVTLEFPAGAVDTSPATWLFTLLETGSIVVLDDQSCAKLGVHATGELPSDIEIGWLPNDGRVVYLRTSGPGIPIEASHAGPCTIDALRPGLWIPNDFYIEISFSPDSPPLFRREIESTVQ
jgi:hypothetical protein